MSLARPVVAIIGRPNVGKSTLFNRIAGTRRAIVHDQPGVTRDRLELEVSWTGRSFVLVDTGGFTEGAGEWDTRLVTDQARKAVAEADAVIFLVDAAAGLSPHDADVAEVLRRSGKPVHLAVNKVDHVTREPLAAEFSRLGFAPVHAVSAEHGLGINDLLDAVTASFPASPGEAESAPGPPRIAVVGRPNVGKSTLVNRLLGEERMITHHEPGTTRDAVDSLVVCEGRPYILVDTAGIRRRGKVQAPVEKYSVMRAVQAIERSDVCLLLLDGLDMVTEQDAKVASLIQKAGRACLILVNKWDERQGADRHQVEKEIREAMPFMDWAPLLFISGKTGLGVHRLFPAVDEVNQRQSTVIPDHALNTFLYRAVNEYKPASFHGKAVSFGYMTQARPKPPTFVVLVNDPARVHFTYRRYLLNRFREEFGFEGLPVTIRFRSKK